MSNTGVASLVAHDVEGQAAFGHRYPVRPLLRRFGFDRPGPAGWSGILPHEQVDLWNVTNGNRIQTYALEAPRGSRTIGINGAAARHFAVGDTVIIAAFCGVDAAEARQHGPTVLILAHGNEIKRPA